jgi:vacuolar-type H+-ATPase subunit H
VSKESSDVEVERIDAAFNRVLAAEAAARERVEVCRVEAERLVAEAEARARRIASRTDDRVLAVQGLAEAGLRRALAELPGIVSDTPGPDLDPLTDARLDEALEALADEMIGVGPASRARDRQGAPG